MMPKPAVADILTKHFIEARHHTDHPVGEIAERNDALQLEMQGDPSLPFYMLINPKSGEVYGTYAGAALTIESFVTFLSEGVEKSRNGRVALAD